MTKYYIPLPELNFNTEKLLEEFCYWGKPFKRLFDRPFYTDTFSFTTTANFIHDKDYKFRKFKGISSWKNNIRCYEDGTVDGDIVHWPDILQNSYMKEVGDTIANLLEIPSYRCRGSIFETHIEDHTISYHRDEHTPHRVHLALATTDNTAWLFRDSNNIIYTNYQRADGVPVLIDTKAIEHSFRVPANSTRIHLWYQFYEPVKQEFLDQHLGISCS
jgi:hypothetical protein